MLFLQVNRLREYNFYHGCSGNEVRVHYGVIIRAYDNLNQIVMSAECQRDFLIFCSKKRKHCEQKQ